MQINHGGTETRRKTREAGITLCLRASVVRPSWFFKGLDSSCPSHSKTKCHRSLASGFAQHLGEPVDVPKLVRTIGQLTAERAELVVA